MVHLGSKALNLFFDEPLHWLHCDNDYNDSLGGKVAQIPLSEVTQMLGFIFKSLQVRF
jgi:hypothetical protein